MKKLLCIFIMLSWLFSMYGADVVLIDFDSNDATVTPASTWGGSFAKVSNPVSSGINSTANCGKVGRTGSNYYEAMQFNTVNSYTVPENTKRYIHVKVNCTYQAVFRIQVNKLSPYIAPKNQYTADGTWQDLVFEVKGATGGTNITSMYLFCDYGTGVNGTGVLNNSTKFAYFDEMVANDDFLPRGLSTADYVISTFESSTLSTPVYSLNTYAATSSNSTANPLKDALNSSNNCCQVSKVVTDPAYAGVTIGLDAYLGINTNNQYLHVMVYKTALSQIGWQYRKSDNTQVAVAWDNCLSSTTNAWTDYVFKLPTGITIKELSIEIGASSGIFYFDNMVLNNSPYPRGASYMTDNNLYDFESPVASSTTIKDVLTYSDGSNPVSYPVSNPYSTYANTTSNCGKRTAPASTSTWWSGFGFTLTKPMQIDASHRYLHVQMLAPANNQTVTFSVKQGAWSSSDITKIISAANVWQDVVVDLNAYPYITDVAVKCGASSGTAQGDYYFDEIKINGSSASSSDLILSLNNANSSLGSISGAGTFVKGQSVTIVASPIAGNHFINWTENGSEVSQSASYGFTVSAPHTLVANFASNTQSIVGSTTADATVLNNCAQCDITVQQGATFGVNVDKTFNSLTVSPGGQLNLSSGKSLSASSFVLQSNDTLTATYLDNGGTLTATTSTVQQYLAGGRNWYISSPVSNATSAVFNPLSGSNKLYWYDEVHGTSAPWSQVFVNDSILRAMKGYVVNMATDGVVSFSGTLNSGAITVNISRTSGQTKEGFNLVGNPYPSYLSWDQVTKSNLESPSIWQRTKNGSGSYVFDTYNAAGQMATNNSGKRINGHIPPMQAFWVRVATGQTVGSLTVDNTMRSHKGSQLIGTGTVSDPAFKLKSTGSQSQVFTLQVSNGINSDETIIYTNTGASNAYDMYDSQKMFSNSSTLAEIFTLENNEPLAINGFNNIPYDTEIPVGFNTQIAGNFSMKASQIRNFDQGTQAILKDYIDQNNPIITDLSDGSNYSFTSGATQNNTSRFTLIFRAPQVATGISSQSNQDAWVSVIGGKISINGNLAIDARLDVFNALGQKIQSSNLTATQKQLSSTLPAGAYLVSITNAGRTTTKRIIVD